MLSPISRLNQSIQSPVRNMESIKKIGHPPPSVEKKTATKSSSKGDKEEKNNALAPKAPSLFGLPTQSNYDPSTGMGKPRLSTHCSLVLFSPHNNDTRSPTNHTHAKSTAA